MITSDEYFQDSITNFGYTPTEQDYERADDLLTRVNALLDEFGEARGCNSGHRTRAKTLQLRAQGVRAAIGSKHEQSLAVDVADADNTLDMWISSFDWDDGKANRMLESHGLWREATGDTLGWAHLQTVAPASGRRTFFP